MSHKGCCLNRVLCLETRKNMGGTVTLWGLCEKNVAFWELTGQQQTPIETEKVPSGRYTHLNKLVCAREDRHLYTRNSLSLSLFLSLSLSLSLSFSLSIGTCTDLLFSNRARGRMRMTFLLFSSTCHTNLPSATPCVSPHQVCCSLREFRPPLFNSEQTFQVPHGMASTHG